ncbi:MAG TPA: hypothetical protein VIS55_08975 [Pseudomonadales bacterium]|jgi:hypothetical protein
MIRKMFSAALLVVGLAGLSSSAWAAQNWAEFCAEKAAAGDDAAICNVHCNPEPPSSCSNPEIDGSQAGIALALILGIGLLVSERRRKPTA